MLFSLFQLSFLIFFLTVPARQPSQAVAYLSPLRVAGGRGGLCIGKQKVGTYIYSIASYTHTLSSWSTSS